MGISLKPVHKRWRGARPRREPEKSDACTTRQRGPTLIYSSQAQMAVGLLSCTVVVIALGLKPVRSTTVELNLTVGWVEIELDRVASEPERNDVCWNRAHTLRFSGVSAISVPSKVVNSMQPLQPRPGEWLQFVAGNAAHLGVSEVVIPRPATINIHALPRETGDAGTRGPAALTSTLSAIDMHLGLQKPLQVAVDVSGVARAETRLHQIDFVLDDMSTDRFELTLSPGNTIRFQTAETESTQDVFCHSRLSGVRALRFASASDSQVSGIVKGSVFLLGRKQDDLAQGEWLTFDGIQGTITSLKILSNGQLTLAFNGRAQRIERGADGANLASQVPSELSALQHEPTWAPIVTLLIPILGLAAAFIRWVGSIS